MQIEPAVASGIPLAVMNGGMTAMMVPVSGGPDAPGLIITIAPMLTGGPGTALLPTLPLPQKSLSFTPGFSLVSSRNT